MTDVVQYNEDNIRSLEWQEHIRLRPGMYIGKMGDGTAPDDGIYILIKEVVDNAIDEFVMGAGKTVEISVQNGSVTVRDFGRGIPLGKMVDAVSKMNTGAKYDSKAFKKSVGLNGVGTKAVNALSSRFLVQAIRDNQTKTAVFEQGVLVEESAVEESTGRRGTKVVFTPDPSLFSNYRFQMEYVEKMVWNYVYLNPGLSIYLNGEKYFSENGLKDLLQNTLSGEVIHDIVHLRGEDIEIALVHAERSQSEQYHSFVNGQHTTQGGTHQTALREALVQTLRGFYQKQYDPADIRQSVIIAISIKVIEPIFESQTKTKLGSNDMGPDGPSIRSFIADFLKTSLDNFLHRHPEIAEAIQRKILRAERERKELSGIQKLARERAKKATLHNRKLRDCKIHYNDLKNERRLETTLFITEGDSASGSITASRDVLTQAVFSLKGKPLNCYGLTKKVVYENEEFNLLQAALNIEDGLEDLRYNNVVVATDADVDGMHIRLLLITFFLQFFPELVQEGHLYILQTPLFRVRNKQKTTYCYSDEERRAAIAALGPRPEITRFKGLGEISPGEFKHFIGGDIRLEPVMLGKEQIDILLEYYMGKNTPERQEFIIENLRVELDEAAE
ncbi:MAG: type IIA DNA topoisomerase subunit B [Schleiferiaceae bacterium]|nr:type IIA DNA topoisomerase subunit B [Schleiferiaceae bacterium]MDP4626710.1 type IIA DNA topoisomerase subunit B [Schleiferiaceae bacterium]MDP4728821.1 type IIA DNA topoisomerase subunit B [Schleiferiaceae bacterium]MDP4860016.1 type IIA DNA topoisomerase subunit B [Schleiferiaceae bacterium]MDP4901033.1 type IIA DNA topoisomerase subunit B [Schleiferiaceae bacterium]